MKSELLTTILTGEKKHIRNGNAGYSADKVVGIHGDGKAGDYNTAAGEMTEFGDDNGVIYVDTPEEVLKEAIELVKNERAKAEAIKARMFVETYSWDSITDECEVIF